MKRRDLFRHPVSWVILVGLSFAGVFYIYNNFSEANSLINLNITMDRGMALEKAAGLASRLTIGPNDYKQTVAFNNDDRFQTFVELEAGGLDSFKSCLKNEIYSPYYWNVRHFKEYQTNEASFWFTPEGRPCGFYEKIAESEKGAALPPEDARQTAEHLAANIWDIDLSPYKIAEISKEEKISGRVDHTFVYERGDVVAGEGRYRLKLVVSGDRLTEVRNFVKIPDDFDRRYNEMRSSNDTIGTIASGFLILVYGLIGVVFGLFFLIRKRWLIWKQPAVWGISIAFASVFLLTLNSLQISWFGYDTSASQGNFLFRQIIGGLLSSFGFGSIIAVSAMAAEGLGRMAFPQQIQFWKIWSTDAATSKQVLGQTLAGYLFAILILALDVFYYVTTTTHFGWWSPAGSLSDPNILANYFPWLDSIAISLQAGFWEETLFRAVPIAGIFLLVKNNKFRNFWIILVLILQTLVFGAAHANYPNQPSYARVLEMVLPFAIMGVIYIYYGLLPAIIAHFSVDVFWISLPLWVSSYPGIWIDRLMVVLLLFAPAWVILFFFIRKKKLGGVPDRVRNFSWEPPVRETKEKTDEVVAEAKNRGFEKWLLPAGVGGLILWLIFTQFRYDAPILRVPRDEAVEAARQELTRLYNPDFTQWEVFTSIPSSIDTKDIFVWKEGGKEKYSSMLGTFLPPPYWEVRYVKTKGSVEERAEEFSVLITGNEGIYSVSHNWPESKAGSNLQKDSAQLLVDAFLLNESGKKKEDLKEISVSPGKLENRTDWEFIYADTLNYPLGKGQGRMLVKISGNEVSRFLRYVYVPEDWIRDYKNKESKQSVVKYAGQVLLIGIIVFGLILGIIRWTRKKFSFKVFLTAFAFFILLFVFDTMNNWKTVLSDYPTELPFGNFMTMMIVSLSVSGLFLSLFNAIFMGATVKWLPVLKNRGKNNVACSIGLGAAAYGLFSFIKYFLPDTEPSWPDQGTLNCIFPFLGESFSGISEVIIIPALMITVFIGIQLLTSGFSRRKILAVLLLLVLGCSLTVSAIDHVFTWLVSGLATGGLILLVYLLFVRFHFEWLPITFGIFPVFSAVERMVAMPTGISIAGGIVSVIITSGIIFYWYRQVLKHAE